MKKFLSFVLFLALACTLMLVYGDELRQAADQFLPDIQPPSYNTGPQDSGGTQGGTQPSGGTTGISQPSKPAVTPTPIIEDGGYYFDQLSDISKTVYSAIYTNCKNTDDIDIILPVAISVTKAADESEAEASARLQSALLSEIQPALDALAYDHPEIDWIRMGDDGGSTFRFTQITDGDTVKVEKLGFTLVCEEREGGITAHSEALAEAIAAVEIFGENRYEILLAIQAEICARTVYTSGGVYAHDAAGVFLKGEAVCDGYAKAFKLLCDKYGIPCIIVAGRAVQSSGSEAHAWNYVQMEDGLWYAVDVTWNDKANAEPTKDYFLVGLQSKKSPTSATFAESHLPSGHFSDGNYEDFVFPALSDTTYILAEPEPEETPELEI